MPHFKSINFYQNSPKLKLFKKKFFFRALRAPPPDPRNSPSPLQISGLTPEFNHVFALLISMPPKFFLMPRSNSINFYQNNPEIKLFLQKHKLFQCLGTACRPPMTSGEDPITQPLDPLQVSGYAPNAKRVLLIHPS